MIALYLIVHVVVQSVCPQSWPSNYLHVTPTASTDVAVVNSGGICSCSNDTSVSFTLSKEKAEAALTDSRVWKVDFYPASMHRDDWFKSYELKREAKTTFSVTETPEEIK